MNPQDTPKKVRFRVDEEVETVWAEPLGENRYRLDNTPWFAYGVSWKDVVEAKPEIEGDNMPDFIRVVEKSGHRTIRVILEDEKAKKEVLEEIVKLGCTYEGANDIYFGVDIPPDANLEALTAFLTKRKEQWEHGDPTYSELYVK